ncbi:cobalamin biosynthesis protein [Lentibacter algarum]|uniref:cobalamin biosynthesis protein n=1 Tax=Lentibacter algarum TaxID=576131 RepID=UPI001C065928|nr:cobalamin biosynthesis protein [Lentibacter algarum]MBU2981650.1 cobalamin biosynthesis protein [Lentibacter algarum]
MIVAGFGFRQSATLDSLRDAYAKAGHTAQSIATAADKAEAPAFQALAAELDLPIVAVAPEALEMQTTTSQSQASQAAHQTGSVSEASALAAAGPQARLLSARVISDDRLATCAIATIKDAT